MIENTNDDDKILGIERQLDVLLRSKDKYSWPNMYRLMDEVERNDCISLRNLFLEIEHLKRI